jgi:hypothetical protein
MYVLPSGIIAGYTMRQGVGQAYESMEQPKGMVFIMAAQTLQLLAVILFGPYIARTAAHFVRRRVKS